MQCKSNCLEMLFQFEFETITYLEFTMVELGETFYYRYTLPSSIARRGVAKIENRSHSRLYPQKRESQMLKV